MASKDRSPEAPRSGQLKRRLMVAASATAVVAACVGIRLIGGREDASAQAPPHRAGAAVAPRQGNAAPVQAGHATSSKQQVVAVVNGEEIHRQQLAQDALSQFGKDVLEGMITKYLIASHAKKMGVVVTRQEVNEEIERLAKKFAIPPEQWLKMIQDERGIKPDKYADEIIWPTLILRKMAADRIQPTATEIEEAYQSQFGPSVRARLIVLDDRNKAQQVHAQAVAHPDEFGALARKHSIDPNSASLNGLIQPIRKNVGDPQIEQAAFSLQEGQISGIIEANGQFAILKCEGHAQTAGAPPREQVRGRLEELIRDRKLRTAAGDLFQDLQQESQVVNVLNDPQRRAQMPGVAASINGQQIDLRQLAEECIERHGDEVLEVMINRKLLEQELKTRRMTVNQAQIDAEMQHAALLAGRVTRNGKPDVDGWLKIVVEEQGVPLEKYIRDSVWPSAALKLLVNDKIKVTEEDIERGYKANYGSKAQVRAIVLDNQRRAQEVWQEARNNPSVEFFGKLAEQYSIEPASKANSGRVPPIQQCGGQPELEKEAFSLQPGEISGIIQAEGMFFILYLEQFTPPIKVSREEVRSLIAEDVQEKKLRFEMGREFDRIKDKSHIDNFLAGTTHTPRAVTKGAPAGPTGAPRALPPGPGMQRGPNVPAQHQAPAGAPQRSPAIGRPQGAPPPRAGTIQR